MAEDDIKKPSGPQKAELMSEISKALARRREARRLSLNEVSQNLKIRVPVLKAIESGNWDELPGGVYLKGFLAKYANFLGFDGEKLVGPYFKKPARPAEPPPEEEKEEAVVGTEESDRHARALWVALGLGVVLVMGLIKYLAVDYQESVKPKPRVVEMAGVEIKEEPEAPPPPPPKEHTLQVFTPYPLWLKVEAEDRMFEGFVPQGSTWSWKGAGEFAIRIGHTNEVALFIDGEKVELGENQKRVYLPNEG